MQVQSMIPMIASALDQSGVSIDAIDAIAVTYGPGLLGSLLVGTTTARVLASLWGKPLIPVHHTLGHLSSPWLRSVNEPAISPTFPVLTLSVSGGHTEIWHRLSHTEGSLVSTTRDDAAGEAFDKGAVLLSLPYPGGPSIANAARDGNEHAYAFPLPLSHEHTLDFSFSGLKTSLKYLLRDRGWTQTEQVHAHLADLAASYQYAICRHLADRITKALSSYDVRELHLVGGVSANVRLRAMLTQIADEHSLQFRAPSSLHYCTDNAAMIAAAAHWTNQGSDFHSDKFTTNPSVPLSAALVRS